MKILAIETSCDETAAAIVDYTDGIFSVQANSVSSQVHLHARYGGVVPNLAAREHEKNIIPIITETLSVAKITPSAIDLIAVTAGPGLIPALAVGVSAAKTLSYVWRKPLIGIHHIEGHIYANFIEQKRPLSFPLLALVVSGGHTQLVLMHKHFHYTIIGQTRDDAVGEAFDKVARMLGLPYPGGPAISATAEGYSESDPSLLSFTTLPRPMIHSKDYDFSFSGIKTAVLYRIRDFRKEHKLADDTPLPTPFINAMSAAFQEAVSDVLIAKTLRAVNDYGVRTVTLAGGVSANTHLRTRLGNALAQEHPTVAYHMPPLTYCLDNAAMIASAAAVRFTQMGDDGRAKCAVNYHTLDADANLSLDISDNPATEYFPKHYTSA